MNFRHIRGLNFPNVQRRAAFWVVGGLALLVLCMCPTRAGEQAARGEPIERESPAQVLSVLIPDPARDATIAGWVKKLGSPRFAVREEASSKLLQLGYAAQLAVQEATGNKTLEVRHRARQILRHIESDFPARLRVALAAVKNREADVELKLLFAALPRIPQERHRDAELAAAAVANGKDAPFLLKQAESGVPVVRSIAVSTVAKVIGKDVVPSLRIWMDDGEDLVAIAALECLAAHEPRECLDRLVELLESKDPKIRIRSAQLLRALTGQALGYSSHGDDDSRKEAIERWGKWLAKNKATAKLRSPLDKPPLLGRTLLCVISPNKIVELDREWNSVLKTTAVATGCGCQGLPNGHRVFSDWGARAIVEIDHEGKQVWKHPLPGTPNSLHRLPNGNTLVGLFSERKLQEVRRDGTVAWEIDTAGQPTESRRLENGNTLVALFGTDIVAELDHNGKTVWKMEGIRNPESARRLPNGNTLIACSNPGHVAEYTPQGKVVWKAGNFPRAYDAVQLENGNILVGWSKGVSELSQERKIIRTQAVGAVRRISVY